MPSAAASTSLAGLSLSTSGLQHPGADMRPKVSAVNPNATLGNNTAQTTSNQASLSSYVLPAPSKGDSIYKKCKMTGKY